MNPAQETPRLVAHRGYAARYPENTLEAVSAALEAGAQYVEVDIQLSADGIPVLFHDADLARTTDGAGQVMEHTLAQLRQLSAGEPARFGARFAGARIPTLDELAGLLEHWPDATAFLELKEESLARFGTAAVTEKVLQASQRLGGRRVLISYSGSAIAEIHRHGGVTSGWVLRRYDEASRDQASALAPAFLICNHTKLPPPPEALWPGPWAWMIYEVTDPGLAMKLRQRGARYIETMDLAAMTFR